MASLKDVTKLGLVVNGVPIVGISGRAIGSLIARFPVLGKMLEERKFNQQALLDAAPDAVAAIIAAGIGKANDREEEAAADALPVGVQLDFLMAIYKESFPNGLSELTALARNMIQALPAVENEDPSTTAPALN